MATEILHLSDAEYFSRREVSNSDLTALKELMAADENPRDPTAAFRFGSLFDAWVTAPDRINHVSCTLDGKPIIPAEYDLAKRMYRSLQMEAKRDPFLAMVLAQAETQVCMVNQEQPMEDGGFEFTLPVRCKWDWWLPKAQFGGDLKTTSATSQREFDEAIRMFEWDRSRAFYMDIAGSQQDFIYGVSKKNCKVFKAFIRRGDDIYNAGKEKYSDLAFKMWCYGFHEMRDEKA